MNFCHFLRVAIVTCQQNLESTSEKPFNDLGSTSQKYYSEVFLILFGHRKKTAWATWNVMDVLLLSSKPSVIDEDVMQTVERFVILRCMYI